ncbi:MAG: dolichol kinase [Cyanobacteria bacterium]|nr:dolichol kinase [Cyanobacteriota bacterium]
MAISELVRAAGSGPQGQSPAIAVVGLYLAGLLALALLVRRRWPEQREWSRKLVHMGTGPVVLLAWALQIERGIAVPVAAAVTVLTALNHRFRLLPAVEDVGRPSYGTVAYGASITLLLALFWPAQPAAVAAGVLVMAFGDGLAGLLGPLVRSPSWSLWGQRKSLVGTGAMAIASAAVLSLLWFLQGPAGAVSGLAGWAAAGLPQAAAAILGITALAVGLEQLSAYGLDNLSVPLVVGLLWSLLRP